MIYDSNQLADASDDLKMLLDRGYRKDSALSFVADHHQLDATVRNRLMREVYSDLEISDTESKILPIEELEGRDLVIDGFNVLITIETGFIGGELFLSQDGMVRDNSMTFSNYKISETTEAAVDAVITVIAGYRPLGVTWVFDSQISASGRLAEYVRKSMAAAGIRGNSMTCPNADGRILELNMTTATSDTQLIRRLESVVDIPQAVLLRLEEEKRSAQNQQQQNSRRGR